MEPDVMRAEASVQAPGAADEWTPTCVKCSAPCTTAMMAAFCPYHRECEFWPDDEGSAEFMDSMRAGIAESDSPERSST